MLLTARSTSGLGASTSSRSPQIGASARRRRHADRNVCAATAPHGSDLHTAPCACTARRQLLKGVAIAVAAALLHPRSASAATAVFTDLAAPISSEEALAVVENAIIGIFERNTYSVVNIFDRTIQAPSRVARADQPEGNGTGFVWDKEGHIVTNYHVLGNALQQMSTASGKRTAKVARVTLLGPDGVSQTFDGYLVGADRSKDLAVLKVNAPEEKLQPVTVGSSNRLRVGQQVLCIGNPFGFDHTLTTGVISGVNREIQSRAGVAIGGGIQTDAAINPGNSGGPLLDSGGRVIGVNTAIFTNTGSSAGVGFAIPVDAVARAVPELISYGKVVRPSLRVQVATDQVAASLRVGKGALIQSVDPSSNAGKAGLLGTRRTLAGIAAGDVVVGFGDRAVDKSSDLASALDKCSIGDKVMLKVKRDAAGGNTAKELSFDVVLQEEVT